MTVTIELFEEVNLEGKYLVTGFHGIGVVGYISCKYMIEQTGARRIGTIVSTLMPPLITLDDKGDVLLPFELYLDDKDGIVFLVVRFQPSGEEMREFTKEMVSFIIRSKMKGLVLLGGLDYNFKPQDDEKGYRCVVTNGFPVKGKPPLIDAGLFISGGIAMLLIELQLRKVPALTLFPYADREHPDMKAAAKAIEIINETFGTNIQTNKLQEEAKDLEKEVNQILKQQVKENANHDMYM
ncbi:MAG: proteasome assembly chaperone family protein [Candidatus Lokiarchaeota archaeon]|nr:proteasome assembly chaperone family protein [Candidatus Lokiarchaeota archaeon]